MTRQLRAAEGTTFAAALKSALDGSGDAVFAGVAEAALPTEVPRRIALVVQSSGTSGSPKRVALSADALLAGAAASESALGGPGQWLLALPTSYIAGIAVLVRSFAAATEVVHTAPGSFTPDVFVAAAKRLDHAMRFTSLVPAQLARLLESDAATDALRGFERVLLGGQHTPAPLLARAADLGVRVTRTYGSSETAGGCVYDGLPVGATRARIVDGEIQLSGPTLAEGYLDDPVRTAASFIVDGGVRWYRTGDGGALHGPTLSVTGRLDDVIITGGLKVSLGAVENIVRALPGLGDAVVVRRASEHWGEESVVVTSTPADVGAIADAVRTALGRHAAPAQVVVLGQVPQLASGKPDRLAARRAAEL